MNVRGLSRTRWPFHFYPDPSPLGVTQYDGSSTHFILGHLLSWQFSLRNGQKEHGRSSRYAVVNSLAFADGGRLPIANAYLHTSTNLRRYPLIPS